MLDIRTSLPHPADAWCLFPPDGELRLPHALLHLLLPRCRTHVAPAPFPDTVRTDPLPAEYHSVPDDWAGSPFHGCVPHLTVRFYAAQSGWIGRTTAATYLSLLDAATHPTPATHLCQTPHPLRLATWIRPTVWTGGRLVTTTGWIGQRHTTMNDLPPVCSF